jgi:hypothetical protein
LRGPGSISLAGKRVNVHTTPEGKVIIYDGKKRLEHNKVQQHPISSVQSQRTGGESTATSRKPNQAARRKQMAYLFSNPKVNAA